MLIHFWEKVNRGVFRPRLWLSSGQIYSQNQAGHRSGRFRIKPSQKQLVAIFCIAVLSPGFVVNPAVAKSPTIVINEVDCHGNDWVELLNKSNESIDISNWLLTDKKLSVTNPLHIYRFPAGTVIGKGARLVVEQSGTGEKRLPFGVGCLKGGVIRLGQPLSPTSMVLVDELTIAITPAGATFGRVPDGAATSGLTLHSKGSRNISALPVLKSAKTLTCRKNKACQIQLKASTGAKFSIASNSLGATVSSNGLLKIPGAKVKLAKLKIKLANSYGAAFVLLTVSVR